MVQGPRGQSLGELWKRGDAGKVGPAVSMLSVARGGESGRPAGLKAEEHSVCRPWPWASASCPREALCLEAG